MPSSSDSDDDRRLPMAYRSRKRRVSSSSSSSKTYSDSPNEDYRYHRRRSTKRKKKKRRAKKDKPMWKEEGEISDDGESSCNSNSSRSRSRSHERTRRRRRREPGRRYAEKRTERSWRSEPLEKNFRCKKCGCRHVSLKGLIHHQMNDHSLDAQCHYCLKKFKTKDEFREHHELEHPKEAVKCIFCKSCFERPMEMDEKRWDDLFSHLYGEILYSRLADYTEDEEKGATENAR